MATFATTPKILPAQLVHAEDKRRARESQEDPDDEGLARRGVGQRAPPPGRGLPKLLLVAMLAPVVEDAVTMAGDPSDHGLPPPGDRNLRSSFKG
jgi:hypothetical protein